MTEVVGQFGLKSAPGGIRTHAQLISSQPLYPLSYWRMFPKVAWSVFAGGPRRFLSKGQVINFVLEGVTSNLCKTVRTGKDRSDNRKGLFYAKVKPLAVQFLKHMLYLNQFVARRKASPNSHCSFNYQSRALGRFNSIQMWIVVKVTGLYISGILQISTKRSDGRELVFQPIELGVYLLQQFTAKVVSCLLTLHSPGVHHFLYIVTHASYLRNDSYCTQY